MTIAATGLALVGCGSCSAGISPDNKPFFNIAVGDNTGAPVVPAATPDAVLGNLQVTPEATKAAGEKKQYPTPTSPSRLAPTSAPAIIENSVITCNTITDEKHYPIVEYRGFPTLVGKDRITNTSGDNRFATKLGVDGAQMVSAEPGVLAKDLITVGQDPYKFTTGVGGFTAFALQEGKFTFKDGREVGLIERQDTLNYVVFREPYNGNKAAEAELTCSVPMHVQRQNFGPGAYVSEGQIGQVIDASKTGKDFVGKLNDNCGGNGCRYFVLTSVDLNTGAYWSAMLDTLTNQWYQVGNNWLNK